MNRCRMYLLTLAILVNLLLLPVSQVASAQTSQRCFSETGFCIAGRIRQFWEQNGGLSIFGFPITPLQIETVNGKQLQVQWFERNRLELHPENASPYDVLLGRLGVDRLRQTQRSADSSSSMPPDTECQFFAETGQNVCGDILTMWRAHGLALGGQTSASEAGSLALFGLPLTGLEEETLSDGKEYLVPWFERARFEIHPENGSSNRVQLGLLGRESGPIVRTPVPQVVTQPVAQPVRMVIDAIGLNFRIQAVGVDSTGAPIVPDHNIGWFNQSAMPGQGDNVVFWGHVLRFVNAPNIPAPFANLKNAPIGARIVIYDSSGNTHVYRISKKVWVTPDQVQYILPQGSERVTLVSCIGQAVIANGEVVNMSNRLITIGVPEA